MNGPSLLGLLTGSWRLDWGLSVQAALITCLYLWGPVGPGNRGRGAGAPRSSPAVATILIALESGLDTFDEGFFSVHMVQHLALLTVAPLLLLGGRPALLALRALPAYERRILARALVRARGFTGPFWCLGFFTAVVLATHVPAFYDGTLRHPALHDAEHLAYLIAGSLMWWPLLDADPAPSHRLTGLGRLVYLLAAMSPMVVIGAYLNRQVTLVYAAYGRPAHALGVSAIVNQQQAGAIMWVAGTTIMVAVGLWAAIAAMVAEERRLEAREAHVARGGPAIGGES